MSKYYFFNFFLIGIAFLSLAGFSVKEINYLYRKRNIKALKIISIKLRNNNSGKIDKFLNNTKKMLHIISLDISFREYVTWSLIMSTSIAFIGILLDNLLLTFLLFLSANILTQQYLKHIYYKELRKIQKDLNLGLSLITNSYLENNNFIKAVKSNIYKLPGRIKEGFSDFLVQVEMVNPDIKKGVLRLKERFDNRYFKRWSDLVIHCIDDRDYIKVLPAVVNEMANEREDQSKYDSIVNEVYKENIQLLVITALTPFILKIVFPEMLAYLLYTVFGKIIIAVSYFLLAVTLGKILTINKPISINKERNE